VARVLIVDDHQMFGQALQRLLEGEDDLQVVGVLRSAEEAIAACGRWGTDVVLMDIDLPGIDGITAISSILKNCPGAQVVVVTALHDPTLLAQAVDAGAAGFLSKSEAIEDLVSVVRRAAEGDIVLPPDRVHEILRGVHDARLRAVSTDGGSALTKRELEVLQAFADGLDPAGVAERLYISPRTVHSHVRSALQKLDVHSTLQAVMLCLRRGLISLGARGESA
jgi:DNA-binding NarL/FixJ family response regulator